MPAFDVNGGYIALTPHAAPLATGETLSRSGSHSQAVDGAHTPPRLPLPPGIAVRTDNFVATSATGSITALATSPLRLRIDITATNAAGETIRLTGDCRLFLQQSPGALYLTADVATATIAARASCG